jgi:hypothetical protein
MAYTTINKSADYFNTKLYTGNGTSQSITGVGFQPDLIWVKERSSTSSHQLVDAVRGLYKRLLPNGTNAESNDSGAPNDFNSFDSDGFSILAGGAVNENSQTYASWNWKAGSSNTSVSASGSGNGAYNACTHRANTTAGFSIVQYTGRNADISNGEHSRVTHGLGVKPDFLIIKRTDTSENWVVTTGTSNDNHLVLNSTNAESGSFYTGNQNNSNSTYFLVGNSGRVNQESGTYIAYCFAEKQGFSKFGKLISNGSDDGAFTYTGFAPKWVMLKPNVTDAWSNWYIFDTARDTNLNDKPLYANLGTQEAYYGGSPATNYAQIDMLSNGFKIRRDGNWGGGANGTELSYMAFGQSLVGSNNVPATAR